MWQITCFFLSMVRIIFCICFLFVFISCGKQHFPDYESSNLPEREEEEDGVFRAEFSSLNPHYTGKIKATTELWIRSIQLYAKIVMYSSPARVRYLQYIHRGPKCPDESSDINRDGVIDMSEVMIKSGEMLIPLDKKLNSQDAGSEWFPKSNKNGAYYYSRSGDVDHIMDDLYALDRHPEDGIGKLRKNESLRLDQKVIVIYGTPSDPFMPVACAELEEIFN